MLFSSFSIIFLLSAFSPWELTYAMPVAKNRDTGILVPRTLQRREGPSTSAIKASTYIKKDRSINTGNLCFYSGSTDVGGKKTPIFTVLNQFTKQTGINCRTLPDLLAAGGFKQDSDKWHNADWTAVSKAMASRAKGTVFVLLGENVSVASVWAVTEKKALESNPRATGIQVYKYKSDGKFQKEELIPISGDASRSPTPSSSEGEDGGARGRRPSTGNRAAGGVRGSSRSPSRGPAVSSSG